MALTDNLKPQEWVVEFAKLKLSLIRSTYGDTPLLLFDLNKHNIDFQTGLSVTISRPSSALLPAIGSMSFDTRIQSHSYSNITDDFQESSFQERLHNILVRSVYFVCPLRKGMHRDSGDQVRITVGRARNQDILLRHDTVSKSHAWFEKSQMGLFFLTDLKSKNGTFVNGNPLEANTPVSLRPETRIAFGNVQAIIIPSEQFWLALQDRSNPRLDV